MSNEMSTGAKGVRLVVGAWVVTMGVTAFNITLAIMFFIDTTSCGAVSRTLPVLFGVIAAVFLASVVVVGVAAWKIIPSVVGRLAIMAVYGVAILSSYAFIALMLLVVFNC